MYHHYNRMHQTSGGITNVSWITLKSDGSSSINLEAVSIDSPESNPVMMCVSADGSYYKLY